MKLFFEVPFNRLLAADSARTISGRSLLQSMNQGFSLRIVACLVLFSLGAWCAAPESSLEASADDRLKLTGLEADNVLEEYTPKPEGVSKWFLLPALINVYPKLESENLIRKYYNPAMRALAPGFSDVRTISDLRDDHLLWTPDFAVGRVLSPRWALYFHFGYSGGKVRTKANNASLFLLPLHTDFEIFRSAAYFGLCADVFPWGMPEHREYHGLGDRLRNTRPSLGFRLTESYAGYKAKAKAGLKPFPNFLNLEVKDNWWVTAFNINVGADIPINKRNLLVLNAGYNFSFSRAFDFDAVAVTVGWKRYF